MGIGAMQYLSVTNPTGTTTGATLWLEPDCVHGFAMTAKTTGTLTGAFKFYKSQDPRARPDNASTSSAVWDEFTTEVASQITNPAGGTAQFDVDVSDFRAAFLRVDYVHTSGTGTITMFFSGH